MALPVIMICIAMVYTTHKSHEDLVEVNTYVCKSIRAPGNRRAAVVGYIRVVLVAAISFALLPALGLLVAVLLDSCKRE